MTRAQRAQTRERIAEGEDRLATLFGDARRLPECRESIELEVANVERELLSAWATTGVIAAVDGWIRCVCEQTRGRPILRFAMRMAALRAPSHRHVGSG